MYPKHRLTLTEKNAEYCSIKYFNKLPAYIRTESNLWRYKKKVFKLLLEIEPYSVREFIEYHLWYILFSFWLTLFLFEVLQSLYVMYTFIRNKDALLLYTETASDGSDWQTTSSNSWMWKYFSLKLLYDKLLTDTNMNIVTGIHWSGPIAEQDI